MTTEHRRELLVVADDLSGAMESAAPLGPGTTVRLDWSNPWQDGEVVDVDTRRHGVDEVERRLARGAEGSSTVRLVKIDSLLRGHVAATVDALREPGRSVVVCPALPVLGRSVADGVVLVNGVPLHETNLWHVEPRPAPRSILDQLPSQARIVHDPTELAGILRDEPGSVLVVDATTQDDVRAIVSTVHASGLPVDLVGSAELARQWPATATRPTPEVAHTARPQLFVLGSAAHIVREQATAFSSVASRLELTAHDLRRPPEQVAVRVADLLDERIPTMVIPPAETGGLVGTALSTWLAELVVAADAARPDLFLCGGETARTALDLLGVTSLQVVTECHPGAALAVTGDGRLVCTRPGSHGPRDSLFVIGRAMCAARNQPSPELQNKE